MREDHAAPRVAGGILRARTHGGSAQSLGIACEGGASDLIGATHFFARRLQDYCCSSASPILIFASLRRLLIRASKTICALFWVIP